MEKIYAVSVKGEVSDPKTLYVTRKDAFKEVRSLIKAGEQRKVSISEYECRYNEMTNHPERKWTYRGVNGKPVLFRYKRY